MEGQTPATAKLFEGAGGRFVTTATDLTSALAGIRALVLDWDGVFNAGRKGGDTTGTFSEIDSMGLNMLRYGWWRNTGSLASVAIVSGEKNETAVGFARREALDSVYLGVQDKHQALEHLCRRTGVEPAEVLVVFDDINDLSMVAPCGARIMVRHAASPLLSEFVARRGLCDYQTANDGSSFAVREAAELVLGLLGIYDEVVRSRVCFDDAYRNYLAARKSVVTTCYAVELDEIVAR